MMNKAPSTLAYGGETDLLGPGRSSSTTGSDRGLP